MKIEELYGRELWYWVARALGWKFKEHVEGGDAYWVDSEEKILYSVNQFTPSIVWDQAGPILIDRGISLLVDKAMIDKYDEYGFFLRTLTLKGDGKKVIGEFEVLVAAMRCLVGSVFDNPLPDLKKLLNDREYYHIMGEKK